MCVALVACFGFLFMAGNAFATPAGDHPTLNWGSQLNNGECPAGKMVLNVTHAVTNDLDSGVNGNWWATDNYNKHIQVWETGTNTFCAVVRYMGDFNTYGGDSPNGGSTIDAGIKGTYEGGYRATITGSLNLSPSYKTKGNIGSFNYDFRNSIFSYLDAYFNAGWDFKYEFWGWIYHGGDNGIWVNADTGNEGDIHN